jgi:hypothetical protein
MKNSTCLPVSVGISFELHDVENNFHRLFQHKFIILNAYIGIVLHYGDQLLG